MTENTKQLNDAINVTITNAGLEKSIWICVIYVPFLVHPGDTTRNITCCFLVCRKIVLSGFRKIETKKKKVLYLDLRTSWLCSNRDRTRQVTIGP